MNVCMHTCMHVDVHSSPQKRQGKNPTEIVTNCLSIYMFS